MTTRNILKRTAAASLIGAAGIAGSLGISAVTAGTASASVASGVYTITTDTFGMRSVGKAVVHGNRLTFKSVLGDQTLFLHQTRNGAWADYGNSRYTFTHRGGNFYTGQAQIGPIVLNHMTLRR